MLYKGAPPFSMSALYIIMNFNPRAPCRARLHYRHNTTLLFCFNPRAPCGARHGLTVFVPFPHGVSIHAPHAGRDYTMGSADYIAQCFNPRAPCGARQALSNAGARRKLFQSTRPMRGATHTQRGDHKHFAFQSTRPMRGATHADRLSAARRDVSIHAPHAGRDAHPGNRTRLANSFNPRAPCGARLVDRPADNGL